LQYLLGCYLLFNCNVTPHLTHALLSCRRSNDDQPALQFTDSDFTEVFSSFCQRKKLESACVQMIKDYIGNMSEKHPGLVLHMLDVLDVITNYADNIPEYVARAQDMYLGQTFVSNLENVRSFMRYTIIFCKPGFGADL